MGCCESKTNNSWKIGTSATINAPIKEVWERIKDPVDVSWAKVPVTCALKEGSMQSTEVGAVRIITMGGKNYEETIVEYDAANYFYDYTIPVHPSGLLIDNTCRGKFSLSPINVKSCKFIWAATAEFKPEVTPEAKKGLTEKIGGAANAMCAGLKSHWEKEKEPVQEAEQKEE